MAELICDNLFTTGEQIGGKIILGESQECARRHNRHHYGQYELQRRVSVKCAVCGREYTVTRQTLEHEGKGSRPLAVGCAICKGQQNDHLHIK